MADIEKVIKDWEAVLSRDPLDAPWDLIDDTVELLKEQPQIVRCRDCRFKEKSVVPYRWWCNRLEKHCDNDWFCADGERSE